MAVIQRPSGTPVASIKAVVGNRVPLKVIPGAGEKLPLTITTESALIATVTDVNNRMGANFTSFALNGVQRGQTTFSVFSGPKKVAGPIVITVTPPIALPDAGTDAGLLTRLLLAEVPTPKMLTAAQRPEIGEAMRLMRVVVANRLKTPSVEWASKGARTVADVVRANGQFAGFEGYPGLSDGVRSQIDKLVKLANDGNDPGQELIRNHIELAITVASGPVPADPTGGKLFWWRTENSAPPSPTVLLFKTVAQNTFYRTK